MVKRIRSKNISIRVSEEEHQMFQRKLEKSGLSLREFFMRCVAEKEINVKEGGLDVVRELKRIGNNLNQLTHAANTGIVYDCSTQLESIYNEIQVVRKTWL